MDTAKTTTSSTTIENQPTKAAVTAKAPSPVKTAAKNTAPTGTKRAQRTKSSESVPPKSTAKVTPVAAPATAVAPKAAVTPAKTKTVTTKPKAAKTQVTKPVVAKPAAPKTKAGKPVKVVKEKKVKVVRDSFTIPKAEFTQLAEMKKRALALGVEVKKSELIRAGLQLIAGLQDNAFKKALGAVPTIKTGRPSKD